MYLLLRASRSCGWWPERRGATRAGASRFEYAKRLARDDGYLRAWRYPLLRKGPMRPASGWWVSSSAGARRCRRPAGGRRRSAGRDDDAVAVDLAVDGRPRHAERFRRLGLVAARIQQRLHDRVPLQRLQRAEQAAADRPAFGRQVGRLDGADPLTPHDLPDDLPELLDVAGPGGPGEQRHRLGGAGEPAVLAELAHEEPDQVGQVLDVVAQRRQRNRARERP